MIKYYCKEIYLFFGRIIRNIQFYQKLTLLDYPSKTACTVFTYGCNLRCPFCHNALLVTQPAEEQVDENEFFAFLEKRKGLLDGVCITGGEPLIQPDIKDFIRKIKDMGYLVKLDTNGFFPEKLKDLLSSGLLDYVAMDIKNSPDRYAFTCGLERVDLSKVNESIDLLKNSGVDFEFRTTAVKEFHSAESFIEIGKWLNGGFKYFIQSFKDSGNTIEKGLSSFTEEELLAFKAAVSPFLPRVSLRGV